MPKGYRKIMGKVKLCYQVLKQNFPMGHLLGSSSLKKKDINKNYETVCIEWLDITVKELYFFLFFFTKNQFLCIIR